MIRQRASVGLWTGWGCPQARVPLSDAPFHPAPIQGSVRGMTAATTSLNSPGQIAANLPGILGFYPHDSLVFVTFSETGSPDKMELGPVLRIDLDDLVMLPELAQAVEDMGQDVVFGFLVTTRPDAEINEVIDTLVAMTRAGILRLDLAWVTREILTGEPVRIGFGPPSALAELDASWTHDVIAPVSSARAMEPLLEQGELPDLNRAEAQEHFRRANPHFDEAECAYLTRFALERAHELSPTVYPALAADARLLIGEARDVPLDDLLADEEVLLTVATLLGTLELRDLLIEDVLQEPGTGAQLMLAVARTFTGFIRHNALAVYALCMVELRLTMRSTHALLAVLEEDRSHSLSQLLLVPAQAGEFEFMVRSVREGSRIVRANHGVEPSVVSTRPGHRDGW
ncbi:MAG: DUF4192 domain-containing protein [Corynebacterium humireducens]|jgi:hypothetical protein|uniref:DUF4192 domain-containing protein n=1 Tax=Corynebacterium humireducens TaxID=1223514 RepID=A0A7X6PNP8_9CORY|nr:DUF4192 domain-containing protein [Corynebacterium humireducens]